MEENKECFHEVLSPWKSHDEKQSAIWIGMIISRASTLPLYVWVPWGADISCFSTASPVGKNIWYKDTASVHRNSAEMLSLLFSEESPFFFFNSSDQILLFGQIKCLVLFWLVKKWYSL